MILNEVSILEVPALSRTGLAALALLLAGAAILLFRRQG
ncbi:MAG: IPTL-CTERM sorting domain-containing protein [Thermoanaerobaculia bacterium]